VIALLCCATSVFVAPSIVMGMFAAGFIINIYEGKFKSLLGYGLVLALLLFAYLAFPNIVTALLINVIPRFLVIGEFISAIIKCPFH